MDVFPLYVVHRCCFRMIDLSGTVGIWALIPDKRFRDARGLLRSEALPVQGSLDHKKQRPPRTLQ